VEAIAFRRGNAEQAKPVRFLQAQVHQGNGQRRPVPTRSLLDGAPQLLAIVVHGVWIGLFGQHQISPDRKAHALSGEAEVKVAGHAARGSQHSV